VSRFVPQLIIRTWKTAVFWTWLFNGLRFAAGIVLIPLLWRMLSKPDLGLYSLFFQFTGFLSTFDVMFAITISRFVGYALRGVPELQSMGIATVGRENVGPNVALLSKLLGVTKRIYHLLSLGILILLGICGTLLLLPDFQKASHPAIAAGAWAITVCSACLELYTGYWLAFMHGLNKVLLSARLSAFVYGFKLALSIILLVARLELLAVPIATLVTGILQRLLARYFLKQNLPPGVRMDSSGNKELLRTIWPNAWRLGLVLLSLNIMLVGFGITISRKWGLAQVAPYHFSQQILSTVCVSMASVWTYVKWPIICQERAQGHFAALQRLIWPRLWLQLLSYAAMAAFFIVLGPPLLKWIAPDKNLLPRPWLLLIASYAFLEMNFGFWTTLISTENRIPSMWASVMTNLSALLLAGLLAQYSPLGMMSFVIAPLICGLTFNYWFWPRIGAQGIGSNWLHFMTHRPRPENSITAAPTAPVAP
jgi:O-antigen/teichoic acid export membrane protein